MNERKWEQAEDDEEDWNFYWISVRFVKNFFHPRYGKRLTDRQLVNHFPNYSEVTKKDLMVKNIKRYKKDVDKKIIVLPDGKEFLLSSDIIPVTYILPQEYSMFMEDFCKGNSRKWIFKPAGRSQGKGIRLINKVAMARALQAEMLSVNQAKAIKETFVISRYIGKFWKIITPR
jgi:tubulin polyglutamylase TTLL1